MPSVNHSKPGSLRDPEVAGLFVTDDPENRFTDLREIGHGSFGAVYFAMDEVTRECVAIKKMSYGGKQSGEKWQDIVREVKFLHQLRHRNIVEFKVCYLKEQTCWLVMEYCVGSAADIIEDILQSNPLMTFSSTLFSSEVGRLDEQFSPYLIWSVMRVRNLEVHKKPLREIEIAVVCQEALHGLQYLHSLGRIHRDVKAGNILLTDQGVVKLADFGSASLVSPAQSFVGTPYWMAPEVILAMEHGRYNQRADVWSLGITCIELAEKRPPYFNMNAMSALYHIAQNDPPVLSSTEWSTQFQDFVTHCLIKDPAKRMSTQECLSHAFIIKPKPPSILYDLIQRTKVLVRNLDHFQYRKLRKIMYLDEQQSSNSAEVSSLDSEDVDSIEDDLIGNDSPSSQSNSLSSMHSQRSTENLAKRERESRQICENMKYGQHGGGSGSSRNSSLKKSISALVDGHLSKSVLDVTTSDETASGSKPKSLGAVKTKEDVLALRRSRFATIKPTVAVVREQNEYATENNLREQMSGYKRMRREHLKEQKQLEEKSLAEMETLRGKLDREYDQLLQQFNKELDRLHQTHRQELDKRVMGTECCGFC
ncbi:unnamed protein product [Soboliphyme baturini]|uniref:non-specific serine/threonine protein kinase n=1 Tax=Soboliphyme baturini TaxID=241478 RepID=A0A183ID97_9BILA|nr:unnamed protein product [Soboliphyme baturini]